MRIPLVLGFFITLICFGCVYGDKPVTEPTEKEIRIVKPIGDEVSGKLLTALKKELAQGIQKEGLVGATRLCNIRAMPLTHMLEVASEYPVSIKRTTFKYRNPENSPDEYEEMALHYLEKKAKIREGLPKSYIQKIKTEDKTYFYYYKPLKVGDLCMNCHGDPASMDPSLVSFLKEKYPEDKAINYSQGDFRGVVRVRVDIPEE
jgi:hypothetical protein